MGKGFASPTQFRGDDIKNALIRNWRQLVTFINTWVVTYDTDATTLALPGDVTVAGDLTVTGTFGGAAYAHMYTSTPVATTISDTTNYVKLAGTTTLHDGLNFTMPSDGRLTYGGSGAGHFLVTVSISQTSASANQVFHYRVAINGTTDAASEMTRKQGTAADVGSLSFAQIESLSPNDYIEVYVRNETSATNVTAEFCQVTITRS